MRSKSPACSLPGSHVSCIWYAGAWSARELAPLVRGVPRRVGDNRKQPMALLIPGTGETVELSAQEEGAVFHSVAGRSRIFK